MTSQFRGFVFWEVSNLVGQSKSAKPMIILLAAALCVLAAVFWIRQKTWPDDGDLHQSPVSQSEGSSSANSSGEKGKPDSVSFPEEQEAAYTERVELQFLPYKTLFRKITFELKDCVYSKNLNGNSQAEFFLYDDILFGENREILNDYSYLFVTFSMKNESDAEVATSLNTSRIYIERLSDGFTEEIAEMSAMNRSSQEKEERSYFHWTFLPGQEEEFTVTFILRDRFLDGSYRLTYLYSPFGRVDTQEIKGRQVTISDAKLLDLNHVIRSESEARKSTGGENPSQIIDSAQLTGQGEASNAESSSLESGIHFWQKGEEHFIVDTEKNNTGDVFTFLSFSPPVYLRDKDQLGELFLCYDELKETPVFDLRSPFDGSLPKYIKLDGRINYCFEFPGRKEEFMISYSFLNGEILEDDYCKNKYEMWKNDPVTPKDMFSLLHEKILCFHVMRKHGGVADYYSLEWVKQGMSFIIDQIPEDFYEKEPKQVDLLISGILGETYFHENET